MTGWEVDRFLLLELELYVEEGKGGGVRLGLRGVISCEESGRVLLLHSMM